MAYPNDNHYPSTRTADDFDVHMNIETLGTYAYDTLGNRLGVIERRGGSVTNPDHYCKYETHHLVDCRLTYDLQMWCIGPPNPTIHPRHTLMNIPGDQSTTRFFRIDWLVRESPVPVPFRLVSHRVFPTLVPFH